MGACEGQRREGGQRGPEGGRLLGRIRVGNGGLPPRWLPSSACISQGPMCRQAHPRAGWDHWLCLAPGHPVQGKGGCGRKCNTHSTGGHVIEGDVGRWQVGMSPRGRMTRGWKGRWHVVLRHVAQAEALACGRSQHPGTREAFQRTHSAPPPGEGWSRKAGRATDAQPRAWLFSGLAGQSWIGGHSFMSHPVPKASPARPWGMRLGPRGLRPRPCLGGRQAWTQTQAEIQSIRAQCAPTSLWRGVSFATT